MTASMIVRMYLFFIFNHRSISIGLFLTGVEEWLKMNFRFALVRICLNMSLNLPTRKDTADAPTNDQWLTTEKSEQTRMIRCLTLVRKIGQMLIADHQCHSSETRLTRVWDFLQLSNLIGSQDYCSTTVVWPIDLTRNSVQVEVDYPWCLNESPDK